MALTRLGVLAASALNEQVGSAVETNEFGVDVGTMIYTYGAEATAYSSRPAPGAAYAGSLPEFTGSYADDNPKMVRQRGGIYIIQVTYCKLNSAFATRVQTDSSIRWLSPATLDTGIDSVFPLVNSSIIPLPEPTTSLQYSAATASALFEGGNFYIDSLNPRWSLFPPVANVVIKLPLYVTTDPSPNFPGIVFQKITVNGTDFWIVIVAATFNPNPKGWALTKLRQNKRCAGAIWEIVENWRMQYFFQGAAVVQS